MTVRSRSLHFVRICEGVNEAVTPAVPPSRSSTAFHALGAAATLAPGAALAKGGGYGASSAPSSSSYSSSSYSSAPARSYAAPARTVVIRQPSRSYYVGGGGPVVVRPPNVLVDYAVPLAFTGLAVASVLGSEEREGAQRRRRSGGLALYAQELADVKSLMRTLEKNFDAGRAAVQRPVSGQYTGDSNEDDQGDQAVVSNLKFGADGSITGDGVDVDGAYTLSGRWSGDLEAVAVPLDPRAAVARPAAGERVRTVDAIDAVALDRTIYAKF